MSILAGIMLPHPPLIIPEIGRGGEGLVQKTLENYMRAAEFLAGMQPDTIIISSPHAQAYTDYFHISSGTAAHGSFSAFHAPELCFQVVYDRDFVASLEKNAKKEHFPAGTLGERDPALDHGTMVPLYFINKVLTKPYKLVRLGLSGLSPAQHYRLGSLIQKTAEALQRRVVFVASGDLSHKLRDDGPYGFSKEGPIYDERIMQIMASAQFEKLFDFSDDFLNRAAECGHRSFLILAGALDGCELETKALSYEGVTGVGYGICTYRVIGKNSRRKFLDRVEAVEDKTIENTRSSEDPYILLARLTVENYIRTGSVLSLYPELPAEMHTQQAGVFVSLHKKSQLRGCIGTIAATCPSIADEIVQNAISAASRDPRFPPVRPDELTQLRYSVDILGKTETISSIGDLDPERYGVIVTNGYRRGLLLPQLEGVETAAAQISIARKKAGIAPDEPIQLERFEVIRHE